MLGGTVIGLTEHGWTTLQQAAPGHVQAVRVHFFDVLTDADIVALDDICEQLHEDSRGQGEGELAERTGLASELDVAVGQRVPALVIP